MKEFEDIAKQISSFNEKESKKIINSKAKMPTEIGICNILSKIKKMFFPAFFENDCSKLKDEADYTEQLLNEVYNDLKCELCLALSFNKTKVAENSVDEITKSFLKELPSVQKTLLTDVDAAYEGDPAAKSKEEIICTYPGFYAIFVYRIAHILYEMKVPFIPRIMTEHAHSKTGIDINPGAKIGDHFFIDHGTGVVIGETTIIGNNVRIYQGVTLGALSLKKGQKLSGKKRHPTVKNNVIIYSGASILGGDTVIGEGAIIGGNTFIVESIADNAKVTSKLPELIIK